MKRISLFMLAILWLVSGSIASAAALPERNGVVTDPVGLFSSDEAEQIKESTKDKKYELLLLTASGLDEAEGERLANEAYDGWKLGKNQLMLVVTVNPNHVHLVFENKELASQVAQSDAGDVKGILDLQFVPLAREGNVAAGVIAVSDYVNEISESASAGNAGVNATTPA